MQLKLVDVLRKTRKRRDPLATKDQQKWLYFVSSPWDGLLYIGISSSPMIRLRQHYCRPEESRLGDAMRGWAVQACLDWDCEFVSASGGFQEEHALISKLRPPLNTYDKPKEPVQSDVTNDAEPPSDF